MRWRIVPMSAVALSAFFVGAQRVHAEEEMVEAGQMSAEQIETLSATDAPAAAKPTETPVATTPADSIGTPVATQAAETTAQAEGPEANRDPAREAINPQKTAFEAEGFWMNAYYFVRERGESWNSLSEKIYGRPDRGELLRKWNHHVKLKVGQVVYYNSPTRPDDSSNMKVFAEDFGYQLEEIVVKKGDSLSKIGEARYGSIYTWKELSALNPEISNPDVIEVGQRLRVQPVKVDTQPVLRDIISTVKDTDDTRVASNGATSDQSEQSSGTQLAEPPMEASQVDDTGALPPAADFTPPPSDTNTNVAGSVAEQPKKEAPATVYKKSDAISFKTSSLLGLMGTALLVLSVGMIITRKFSKARAQKSDSLTNQIPPSKRGSPV